MRGRPRRAAPEARHVAPDFVDSLLAAFPAHADKQQGDGRAQLHATAVSLSPGSRPRALVEPLGETQLAILRLVADGLSNREIADKLCITVGTTKWHLNQIYGTRRRSRTQAVAQARRSIC